MASEPEHLEALEGALEVPLNSQGTSRYLMLPQGTSIFTVPSIYIEMKAPSRHLQGTCRCSRYLHVPSGTSRYIQNEGTLKIKVPSMKKQYFSRYLESRYLRTKVH